MFACLAHWHWPLKVAFDMCNVHKASKKLLLSESAFSTSVRWLVGSSVHNTFLYVGVSERFQIVRRPQDMICLPKAMSNSFQTSISKVFFFLLSHFLSFTSYFFFCRGDILHVFFVIRLCFAVFSVDLIKIYLKPSHQKFNQNCLVLHSLIVNSSIMLCCSHKPLINDNDWWLSQVCHKKMSLMIN